MTQSPARASRPPPSKFASSSAARTAPVGSTLVRLLAALNVAPVEGRLDSGAARSDEAFAERLGQWFTWMDAIALSSVLNGAPSTAPPVAVDASKPEADARRVRQQLERDARLTDPPAEPKRTAPRSARPTPPSADMPVDFESLRQRHLAAQHAMKTQIPALRGRLRGMLENASPGMARLAALDASMEQVVGEREHQLLGMLPNWLKLHFQRLVEADEAAAIPRFIRDVEPVLRAELDLRWQPIDALLDALRSHRMP